MSFADRLFVAILLVLSLLAVTVSVGVKYYEAAPEAPGREVLFIVEQGRTFAQVAQELEERGLVRKAWVVRSLGRMNKKHSRLRAGEFMLHTGWNTRSILDALTRGPFFLHRVSVPEGLPWWQTAKLFETAGLTTVDSFREAVRDREMLRKHGIPADTAEGYLFPETYSLARPKNGDARPIVEAMLREFKARLTTAMAGRALTSAQVHELVIKASIVEKETAAPAERPRIAGVFENRLKKRMLLQSDPTIIYGLGESFDGNIRRRDLEDEANRYNTYRHPGLTPGPICSPGEESLRAVLSPEKHDFIFFVSKGDGSHMFNQELEDHNRAVRKYQLGK